MMFLLWLVLGKFLQVLFTEKSLIASESFAFLAVGYGARVVFLGYEVPICGII